MLRTRKHTGSSLSHNNRTSSRKSLRKLASAVSAFEALEDRRLMSLLGITAASLEDPQLRLDTLGSINYNASYSATAGEFTSFSTIRNVIQASPQPTYTVGASGAPQSAIVNTGVQLQFLVDKSTGTVAGHNPTGGDDLDVYGQITINGTYYDGSTTPLLRGSIVRLGYSSPTTTNGLTTASFDFRFIILGGLLDTAQGGFFGQDIGMQTTISPAANDGLNPNPFGANFSGSPKGILGPTPPPVITTNPSPSSVVVGSGTQLMDTATLSGGFNDTTHHPTGSITFNLYAPGDMTYSSPVFTRNVAINGDGTYSTPDGYTPTAAGTYQWVATYSGDDGNEAVDDGKGNEPVTVSPASPAINTIAGGTVVVGSGQPLTDMAVLSGGFNPTGTITFVLTNSSNKVLDTEQVTANGDATYTTPTGYVPQSTGTYLWTATYSGDTNNTGATDNGQNETASVTPTAPAINTIASGTVIIGSGTKLNDNAVLSGGFNETGTITFTLFNPSNVAVYTDTVTVNGNGTYTTTAGDNAGGYLPTTTGSYLWTATYSGDSNNSGATDNGQNEAEVVSPASPAINTVAGGTVVIGSGAKLKDTAVLSGGFNETGTITFTLARPGNLSVYTDVVTVNGNGTYTTASGDNPGGYLPLIAGSYLWSATYSGDSNNNSAMDDGRNESETVSPTGPEINTVAGAPVVIGSGAALTDTAVLSGGFNPIGTITFTLVGPANTVVDTEMTPVNGNGSYSTPNGFVPTATGTYLWVATYSGDNNNSGATDNGENESEVVTPASPAINTTAGGAVIIGSAAKLTDTAVLSGGYFPTGTITFTLTGPGGTTLDTETVTVNGDDTYSTPNGYLPTTAGTYLWSAVYSGDDNNGSAHDNTQNENEVVQPASPAIDTIPNITSATLGTSTVTLTDTADLSGGFSPTGTITFTLYYNGGSTPVDIETVNVTDNGNYTTPTGFTLPTAAAVTGNYQWDATYSGDTNNRVANDIGAQNEQVTISPASPAINTMPNSTSVTLGTSSVTLKDTAVLSGGYNETGSITFTLYQGNTLLDTETVPVSGNGSYTTPTGYTLASSGVVTGTYQWDASYSGDSNNGTAVDNNAANEQVTVSPASPAINTVAGAPVVIGSGMKLTDTATLSGGYFPTGTITFTLIGPGGTTVDTETVTASGDKTYTTPTGYVPTAVGTYVWHATYGGDSNNKSATDNGQNESETVTTAGPAINTVAGGSVVVGSGAKLSDTAVLSGGFTPTGTITFTLFNASHVSLFTDVVTVSGNGTYTTATGTNPGGYLPTAAGSYLWSATYNGDTNNISVSDSGVNESEAVAQATPGITTSASITPVTSSGAVVAGQFATIGFWHNQNGQAVINAFNGGSSQTLLGNWLATNFPHLFGQSNIYTSSTLTSLGKTSLAGLTNAQVAQVYLGLWTPSGVNKNTYVQAFAVALGLYADTASLGGQSLINNGMASTYGFVITSSGAGTFNVGTNGAAFGVPNNTSLPVTQILSLADAAFTPSTGLFSSGDATKTADFNNVLNGINTVGDIPGTGTGVISINDGSKITDSATLTGGFNETGSIIFQLYAPDGVTVVDTETVPIIGNSTVYTSVGYTATVAGTYNWVASYTGDANNVAIASKFGDEPVTIGGATPAIATTPGGAVLLGSGTKLTDSATLSNGQNPTGTITFILYGPDKTTVLYTDNVTINGNGTYTTGSGTVPGGYLPTTTLAGAGTYYWIASYSGDTNNVPVSDKIGDEPEIVIAPVSISGIAFCDKNLNGTYDTGETLESGTVVGLYSSDSTLLATATSNASGAYSFSGLMPGTYTVKITTPASGDLLEVNHDSVVPAPSYTVTLGTGGTSTGNNFAELDYGSISGRSFIDLNDDGTFETGDTGVSGATVTVTGTDYTGTAVSRTLTTASDGTFTVGNLLPSNSTGYTVTVTPPSGFVIGNSTPGTLNGVALGTDVVDGTVGNVVLPGCNNQAVTYQFGEHGILHGLTATIGFWHNKNGQALINSFTKTSTGLTLANWLAMNMPNLFGCKAPAFNVKSTIGTNLTNQSNANVAAYFISLFNVTGQKSYAQVLATAFACFTTSTQFNTGTSGIALANKYGFTMSYYGTAAATFTVASVDYQAFGLTASTSTETIGQLLLLTNKYAVSGKLNGGNTTLITEDNDVYNMINNLGDITG
jgi:hypothetical protein